MSLRTTYAPAKLVGEKLTHTYDWAPQLGTVDADTIQGDVTFELEEFDGEAPDVAITGLTTADGKSTFTVGEGGPAGFNLAIVLSANTAGGQTLQGRIVVPIVTR
jgi:hypothetical protein